MSRPAPEEFWQARREAIDSQISRVCRVLPRFAAAADDWDVVRLAVRLVDHADLVYEIDGRMMFRP